MINTRPRSGGLNLFDKGKRVVIGSSGKSLLLYQLRQKLRTTLLLTFTPILLDLTLVLLRGLLV